jgi:hypothetical protein
VGVSASSVFDAGIGGLGRVVDGLRRRYGARGRDKSQGLGCLFAGSACELLGGGEQRVDALKR